MRVGLPQMQKYLEPGLFSTRFQTEGDIRFFESSANATQ
jgi:hypothetical protein